MNSNTKKQLNRLHDHELEALARWIDSHGRNWKRALRSAWFTGIFLGLTPGRDRDEATLQGLRTRIGPSRLDHLTTAAILGRLADRQATDNAIAERLQNLRGGQA